MTESTPAEDPNKPLPPTNPAPEGSRPPQEEEPLAPRSTDNPAF